MFVNTTSIPAMEVIAALAEGFFIAKCPKYSDNNYEKYVLVNSHTRKCSFQRGDYSLKYGDILFKCIKKDGCTTVAIHYYLLDEENPNGLVINYDGEHITRIDGNSKNDDTGFVGEYVMNTLDLDLDMVVHGRISNVKDLADIALYNEDIVRDAYQAIGDFAKVIDEVPDEHFPVYVQVPFCEDCNYLFQYQCFSSIDARKICINYRFIGIISEGTTKHDIESGKYFEKGISRYSPLLLPYEVHHLTEALGEAEEVCDKVFSLNDYKKYDIRTSFIMNRFYPKMVVETKYGIFHFIYDRVNDYALVDYSSDASIPLERIPGYGTFPGAFELIKKKLEKLSQEE